MATWETVTLPHGYWAGGTHFNHLELRAVNSSDDAFLLTSTGWYPADRALELVSRCARLPAGNPLAPGGLASSLVVGDLEAVLLHLYRLTFGDSFVGVFRCTTDGCKETLELELHASALLLPPYSHALEFYELAGESEDTSAAITFRLPTAGDLESVAALAGDHAEGAGRQILRNCVRQQPAGGSRSVDDLDQVAVDRIAEAMAAFDPQAVAEFQVDCPACGAACAAQLSAADFLFGELDQRAQQVLLEIHTLARAYHWSEEAILALPPSRRRRYIELISRGVGATS